MRILNIGELLPFVDQKPEFVVLDKGDYQVIDYVYQDKETFDIPELMECRGIKFDKYGKILARPFRKFFNYGERGCDLPAHRPHVITEKLDGSMIHPVKLERRLFFHTRKGHTDVAKQAERYVLSSPQHNYQRFCLRMIRDGWTPIFEYTGPNNRIVLRYEEEAMTLIAMRHTVDGTLYPYPEMFSLAAAYNIPVVKKVDIALDGNVDAFVKHTRELIDAEGYVIYFEDGYMVKIKAEDYVLKHRALDDLGSKKKVMALCCQGFMDDVLPILSEPDAAELIEFNDKLQAEVTEIAQRAKTLAQSVKDGTLTRKTFALVYAPHLEPAWLAGVAFGVMDGQHARSLVLKAMQKNYGDFGVKWRGE